MIERPSPKKGNRSTESKRHFSGTDNPRHLRIINALQVRPRPREDVDRITGAANGPDLVAELRRRGLEIPCARTPCIDRDGHEVMRGIYWLTARDKSLIRAWLARRSSKGGQ
jgi:hypothetical protein